jgi:hypothetical protein
MTVNSLQFLHVISKFTFSILLAGAVVASGCQLHYGKSSTVVSFGYNSSMKQGSNTLIEGIVYKNVAGKQLPAQNVRVQAGRQNVFTDSNGCYTLALVPGLYSLKFTLSGYSPVGAQNYKAVPGHSDKCNIVLEKGNVSTVVNVEPDFKVLK